MLGGQLTSGIWRCIREPGLLVCQQEQISEGSLGEEGEETRGRAEGLEVEVGGGGLRLDGSQVTYPVEGLRNEHTC